MKENTEVEKAVSEFVGEKDWGNISLNEIKKSCIRCKHNDNYRGFIYLVGMEENYVDYYLERYGFKTAILKANTKGVYFTSGKVKYYIKNFTV